MVRKIDHFRPRLGIPRSRDDRVVKRYLQKIHGRLKHIGRKIGSSGVVRNAYYGSNFTGFGAKTGRLAKLEGARPQAFRNRRVIIKVRVAKHIGQGTKKLAAHLKYVERDGVAKGGEKGQLYNATSDEVNRDGFVERAKDDRHSFRLIMSPEDAHQIEDMKTFTREFMAQMQEDLGTKLDYAAVDHFNTDNPHTHIIVRGVTDKGQDLVIARDYIKHGMRHRASEMLTRDLGPRQGHEIADALRAEVTKGRLVSLDRELANEADNGVVSVRGVPSNDYGRFKQSLKQGRLRKLSDLGLAEEIDTGVYRLADNFTDTLKRMGERSDIIKTMHHAMRSEGFAHAPRDFDIFDPANAEQKPIVGRIVTKGLSNELNGEFYVVVDGIEGRTHYAEIGELSNPEDYSKGGIVQIAPQRPGPRLADKTIAEIAAKEHGLYDVDAHHAFDPKASPEFVRTHTRRLEALRRVGIIGRLSDGSFEIPPDFIERTTKHEQLNVKRNPVKLNMLTGLNIDQQIEAGGATWLDKRLVRDDPSEIGNTGFGAEVSAALQRRRNFLLQQDLASERGSQFVPKKGLIKTLERKELSAEAIKISNETGKAFRAVSQGQNITGVYTRQLNLVSGKYALIEKSKEFTIVPWRSVLEQVLNKSVSGTVSGNGISWDITKQKVPGISV